ncbi:ligase-associated DNA damage response exonuclease [Frigidibacter sp. SD6-1]|uniref:ligase-associated DNA damage response exonuclease n=1 Tax=Frigidibacter sp. SD6-1 TaxID=3032581 RepID=UPI0024DF5444|nr:ligase-associated DNA damage response exonuclease [Frigidibacter sp. SD6-1]
MAANQTSLPPGAPPLLPRAEGLYCPAGDFFVDPVRPVARALITHGHGDHARAGHGAVLATPETLDIMAIRYGADFAGTRQAAGTGWTTLGDARVRFVPAGHILGSAQIVIETGGRRIVAAGDFKRGSDPTCADFEPVACDIFISEATFGLPVFRHPSPQHEIAKLLGSLSANPDRAHLVGAYALGKAQRVIRLLRDAGHDAPIYLHGAMARLCDYYVARGVTLGPLLPATGDGPRDRFAGQVILGPPASFGTPWARRFPDPVVAFASGWMGVRQRVRQRGVELPLVISDHSDWPELTATIADVAAEEIWVTHGREEALVRWCTLNGQAARPLHLVGYEDEPE